MTARRYAVIGGGILGTAVARRLLALQPNAHVTVLEKEPELASHQTGRNSGVVHAGLYYTPGSLKARLCRRGVELLQEYCGERGLAYDECGKVLVARNPIEEARLGDILARAQANGVPDVRIIGRDELRAIEPHVEGISGLHSPHTAIVDYAAVTRALAEDVVAGGGTVTTSFEVTALARRGSGTAVTGRRLGAETTEVFDAVIICAGLHADRVAKLAGDDDDPKIVPFRGEYYLLRPEKRDLVKGLVYPVPDPRYPFLGVHLTPRVDGEVMVGPNAVLALAREGYGWTTISPRDLADALAWPGFRAFAKKHWRTGATEMVGSLSKRRFVAEARKYVPELTIDDVVPGPSGIRAQALGRDGSLVDDFRITRRGSVLNVRNAPSPAATSSLAIAEHIVAMALDRKDTPAP
ncbi:FAD dependent oxidoreductase [Arthrobacter crystallopoietes BAB-32]|uniref:FAD dependent oxidoreductase n=1 Tax=Arthrobacter crystallopoietes BAB-32 TaxID=1246476 RepID=N1UYN2_9MICC|nr:L-2-hydroxyglutarate oxidase [Arthrobacter crystallopoietes]EMY34165.1 FAD dependent oxidoreductase [Arthrobacter crystallopoietes BAB-32]